MSTKAELESKFDAWLSGGAQWEELRRLTRLKVSLQHFDEIEDADILSSIERLGEDIANN